MIYVHKAIEPEKGTKKAKARYEAALLGLRDYTSVLLPKLDGVYVQFVFEDGEWRAFSRTGERILSFPNTVFRAFDLYAQQDRHYIGEAWVEEWPHAKINGAARKQSVVPGLQVHLFDSFVPRSGKEQEPFSLRYNVLFEAPVLGVHIVAPAANPNGVDPYVLAASWQDRGTYDGLILRVWEDPFVPGDGTAGGIWKIKPRPDGDFRIVGVTEGKGNRAGGIGAVIVDLGNGKTCEVGAGLTKALVASDPDTLIGRIAKIEYLAVSAHGLLREPSFISLRYDKVAPDVLP